MPVYVDNVRIPWRGQQWCHLVADSLSELHAFAASLGLKRAWFQDHGRYPHYDVTTAIRSRALGLGALPADKIMLVACAKKLKTEYLAAQSQSGASCSETPPRPATWTA